MFVSIAIIYVYERMSRLDVCFISQQSAKNIRTASHVPILYSVRERPCILTSKSISLRMTLIDFHYRFLSAYSLIKFVCRCRGICFRFYGNKFMCLQSTVRVLFVLYKIVAERKTSIKSRLPAYSIKDMYVPTLFNPLWRHNNMSVRYMTRRFALIH